MSYYEDVYRKRLNRYGLDYQSRIQGQRDRNFEDYLFKTIYRVEFTLGDGFYIGSLEPNKQDHSQTTAFLLTSATLILENGTVLNLHYGDGTEHLWLVWWLEHKAAKGYNKYMMLSLTHVLNWEINGEKYAQDAYLCGPALKAISDSIKDSAPVRYLEDNNLYTFVTSYHPKLKKDEYFEITHKDTTQGYIVVGIDVNTTPGVEYISADPVPLRDRTTVAVPTLDDSAESFWLNGGRNNGGS